MSASSKRPIHRSAGIGGPGLVFLACLLPLHTLAAQEHDHRHEHDHGFHFRHPLFAESISPDKKLRLNYSFQDLEAEQSESELELEGEFAFTRSFSVEGGVEFEPAAGELGETHVILKFANYAFQQAGILLGYGIEFGLPTGTAHERGGEDGHEEGRSGRHDRPPEEDIYEVTPFLNAGWITGRWELVAWTLFQIPTNQKLQENVGAELRYNASALYHGSRRLEALVEAFGHSGLSGPKTGRTLLNLAPGLRLRPFAQEHLVLGAAVAFPLTGDRDFAIGVLVSAFYHF